MKIIKKLLIGTLVLSFFICFETFAQEEEFKPVFLTVQTNYRTQDPNVDLSKWFETEKEYFDKVTAKNDLILSSGFYMHYFTPNDAEILLVNVYASWEDIEKSGEVDAKLIEEGWPNEEERNAFFQKQSSFYHAKHSDEVYTSLPFMKPLEAEEGKSYVFYVKKNTSAGQGGSGFKEYFENVTMKNPYIKGYYTHRHLYGADSRDIIEVFVYESLGDFEKGTDEVGGLVEAHWPDEEKRKEFFEKFNKIFSGHGDFVYQNVPPLSK